MSPSSQAVPIYEGHDFYVPTFEVRLDGRPPGREVIRDVLSVTYKDSVKDLDSFELTINNWDAEELRFQSSCPGPCESASQDRARHDPAPGFAQHLP